MGVVLKLGLSIQPTRNFILGCHIKSGLSKAIILTARNVATKVKVSGLKPRFALSMTTDKGGNMVLKRKDGVLIYSCSKRKGKKVCGKIIKALSDEELDILILQHEGKAHFK